MSTVPSIPVGGTTLVDVLRRARARAAAAGRPVLATYVEPLPGVDPLDAFERAEGTEDRSYWARPADGVAVVGVGAAVTVAPSGGGRFGAATRMWRALLDGALCDGPGAIREVDARAIPSAEAFGRRPMLLGGFRFDPARPPDPVWLGYPDAWLAVPRLCLATSPAGRWLATSALVRPGEEPVRLADALERERDRLIGAGRASEAAAVWAAIAETLRHRPGAPPASSGEDPDGADSARDEFERAVAEGAAAVRDGRLEKVVVARAVDWRPAPMPEPSRVLRRLARRYPDCHVFAVARGRKVFLGASPERLVRVEGDRVQATCLAGSVARDESPAADARLGASLLASAKDREEHAIVVRALTSALVTLCEEVVVPPEPVLLPLPDVQHLYTPVTARLRDGVGILDLVERLHPTPAVGGAPREGAMAFIREHERWDRGWYAAPVGWLDASGNGELAVALRSALLDGESATLFAGCGILADSAPEDEYMESELKLRAMRGALTEPAGEGAEGTSDPQGAEHA